jgi:hypothetical protein
MAQKHIEVLLTTFSNNLTELLTKEFVNLKEDEVRKVINNYFFVNIPTKGREQSAYTLYCEYQRPILKKTMTGKELMTALGTTWKALSPEQKKEWQEKADMKNNGVKTVEKVVVVKASVKNEHIKVQRNNSAGKWVIAGTDYVVASIQNKVVIGKLNKKNVLVKLSPSDLSACEKAKYEVDESKRDGEIEEDTEE